jgi:hypothetical protein
LRSLAGKGVVDSAFLAEGSGVIEDAFELGSPAPLANHHCDYHNAHIGPDGCLKMTCGPSAGLSPAAGLHRLARRRAGHRRQDAAAAGGSWPGGGGRPRARRWPLPSTGGFAIRYDGTHVSEYLDYTFQYRPKSKQRIAAFGEFGLPVLQVKPRLRRAYLSDLFVPVSIMVIRTPLV